MRLNGRMNEVANQNNHHARLFEIIFATERLFEVDDNNKMRKKNTRNQLEITHEHIHFLCDMWIGIGYSDLFFSFSIVRDMGQYLQSKIAREKKNISETNNNNQYAVSKIIEITFYV